VLFEIISIGRKERRKDWRPNKDGRKILKGILYK
jgi:hypothetical protein